MGLGIARPKAQFFLPRTGCPIFFKEGEEEGITNEAPIYKAIREGFCL
jgi:hypothetical protein